jgi:hypothetical protein
MMYITNICSIALSQVSEISFGSNGLSPASTVGDESKKSELPPPQGPETDVYNFGILLLEIISGKLPYSEEQGHLVNWVSLESAPLPPPLELSFLRILAAISFLHASK